MTVRALAKPTNKDSATPSPAFSRKPSGKSFYQGPANEGRDLVNPHFGHNFRDVQVVSPSFRQTCPLALPSPTRCPYGGACHTCPARVQAKPKVGQPGDKYEQEADRVADQVMRMPEPQVQRKGCLSCDDMDEEEQIPTKPIVGRITPLIQRQESEPEEEEEEEVVQAKLLVQRQTEEEEQEEEEILQPKEVPGQTAAVTKYMQENMNSLRGTGKPLPESERSFFERRFGHDLSRVRVHSGAQAARLTRAVNARAFTAGQDVVFGAGQYAPETNSGQRLLAHELTHVIQQGSSKGLRSDANVKHRVHPTAGFLQCAYFTRDELKRYLEYLDSEGTIEDESDSDDKAIAVVRWWEDTNRGFPLDKERKALLILEMLSGFTGDEEEQAILELLERSQNSELTFIFGAGGVTPPELESNFHGDEFSWLKEFFDRRFDGGWEAALSGQLKPKGIPITKKWPLFAVFPERAEGEVESEPKVKLRKYIRKIDVKFTSQRDISWIVWAFAEERTRKSFPGLVKKEDFKFDIGKAEATYNDETRDSFDVSGGATGSSKYKTHRTGPNKEIKVYRKGGASYVNPKGNPMPHATFFYRGQAFHGCGSRDWLGDLFAPAICLSVPSHGCIHVENAKMAELYPFIVIGQTKVSIA